MEDGTEVKGQFIQAFVESTGQVSSVFQEKTREIFENNGLDVDEIEADSWHDAHAYADAMHGVLEEVGKKTLQRASSHQATIVPWPDHVETVPDGLAFIADADRQAHRSPSGDWDGSYDFEQIDDSTARVGIPEYSPYPVENFRGVLEGGLEALSESTHANVSDAEPRSDEKAAFEVNW